MVGIAYIKYPDGHSARIAIAELMTLQDGVVGVIDANGNEYLTHISNVVIETNSKQ